MVSFSKVEQKILNFLLSNYSYWEFVDMPQKLNVILCRFVTTQGFLRQGNWHLAFVMSDLCYVRNDLYKPDRIQCRKKLPDWPRAKYSWLTLSESEFRIMNKVFAALLEFAFANYLSRQSQGLLHSHTVKYKQFGRMMNNYFSRRMSRRPTGEAKPKT